MEVEVLTPGRLGTLAGAGRSSYTRFRSPGTSTGPRSLQRNKGKLGVAKGKEENIMTYGMLERHLNPEGLL